MSLRHTPTVPAATAPRQPGRLLAAVKDQRLAFVIVGAVNTAIGFVAFFGFDDLFGAVVPDWRGVPHNTVVLVCAHIVTVLCAFGLYRRLVFRVRGQVWRDLGRFESVYLTSLAANWVLLNLLVELGKLTPKLAQTIIVLVTGLFSWFGHKYFSFRRPEEQIHR